MPLRHRLLQDRRARVGIALVTLFVLLAALAPILSVHEPTVQIDLTHRQLRPPSLAHPFGTDFFSRDVLARVLFGARISLPIAIVAVALSVTLGTLVGLAAGLGGTAVDTLLMRLVDMLLAVPRVFLLLVVLGLWGALPVAGLIAILGLTSWFDVARIVRAEVLSLRAREFVVATQALGYGMPRVALRHLLPNVAAPIIVTATLGVGQMVLLEAGISYLGIGIRPPTPSWGMMIAEGQQLLTSAWWIALFPGLAIALTVMGFSLLGDALRQALDPRTR